MNASHMDSLEQLLDGPAHEPALARAALLIAAEEYPALQVGAYLTRLDEYAAQARREMSSQPTATEMLTALNRCLFHREGFAGNGEDFYDPRNSFLNEVLDRKLGIPITLSIVYLEVAWRIGLPLDGVCFPGHFLVKLDADDGAIVLDPYLRGASLSETDLEDRLRELFGEEACARMPLEQLLISASRRDILVRLLRNLKLVFLHRQEYAKVLAVVGRILGLMPELSTEYRDRGLVYERLECARAAVLDYERYLELQPSADDAPRIHARLVDLKRSAARLN
jgi:regulator of sirC expression with transglutaminase-like and TPR domain